MMRHQAIRQLVLVLVSLLTASVGPAYGQNLGDLRQAWESARVANTSTASTDAAVLSWLRQNDPKTLTNVDDVTWLARWMLPQGICSNKFSVRWTGTLSIPTSGKYTFSTCPINVNVAGDGVLARQTMGIWIGEQQIQILNATEKAWAWQGAPVALEAGAKIPIRVEFSYEQVGPQDAEYPGIAMLYWEGPGLARELVPSTALTAASGATGLDAQYTLVVDGKQQQTATQVEPQIDHFWLDGEAVVPTDATLRQQLAAKLMAMVTDPAYLNSCAKGQRTLVMHEIRLLNSAQRRALVQAVLGQAGALVQNQWHGFSKVYAFCRAAAPDEALEVPGRVVQAFPDGDPNVENGVKRREAWSYGKLAWQYPEHFARLEQRYLVTPDGRCCLWVAYALAYGYAGEKRLDEWIAKLDAQLAQPSLTGDQRVNWLIARAMAEELRGAPINRTHFGGELYLAGHPWLEESCLVAQSESVRLRAYQQLTVRLAAIEDIDGANKLLDKVTTRISEPASSAALAAWRTRVAAIADQFRQQHQEQEAFAQKAYLDSLRTKRQQAIDQHDDESATHYEQLLNTAGSATN